MELFNAVHGAAAQGVLWGIMAIGVFITYSVLHFSDLTVDGSFALGGIISAMLISKGGDPFLSLMLAMVGGALAGMATGVIHTKLKIPGILSSILVQIALYSITLRVGGGRPNIPIMANKNNIISYVESALKVTRNSAKLVVGLTFCIVIVAVLYWFFGTELGSAIRATGDNPHMARALGVNTDAMILAGLMVSNALVALSGALVAQGDRAGNLGIGAGTIIVGLAAVVIGNVLIKSSENFSLRMAGTAFGSVVYQIVIALVLQLGLRTDDQKLFTAIIVLIALSVPTVKQSLSAKKTAKEADQC